MAELETFGAIVLVAALGLVVAILSNRVSERLHVPAPAIFFGLAVLAAAVYPDLAELPLVGTEEIVTVAVAAILFDGGMHIGLNRLRESLGVIAATGVLGTFLTAGAVALVVHTLFGFDWWVAVLLGTAIAPTDPAVVFSVLGRREIGGRAGTILEGESGANDPVGIALLVSLLAAGGVSLGAWGDVAGTFALQMIVGTAIGIIGGLATLWFMRNVPLPSEALYPLRALASGFVVYGLATVLHGSGFLAIFVAGIVLGDERAPYKGEVERFTSAIASLSEVVAFVALGLTVDVDVLVDSDVWLTGILIGAIVTFVVRPIVVGAVLLPFGLGRNERLFVLWSGLKGAVPLLLGILVLDEQVPDAERVYGIVIVVVIMSVLLQGTLVPTAASLLSIPMRMREPEPWALGVRLRHEPNGVHRLEVAARSVAAGTRIEDLPISSDDVWVSFVVRRRRLVTVRGDTVLEPGDEALILADPALHDELVSMFTTASR
ncbi:MAG TPA: cation:proton antiporter [Nocardioidaceae bacterium]